MAAEGGYLLLARNGRTTTSLLPIDIESNIIPTNVRIDCRRLTAARLIIPEGELFIYWLL